jgi:DNA-binding NarL/FixJ family response regulator
VTSRIIVCDDHPVVRDALSTCLRALAPECEVGECASAAQLVDRLGDTERWDLVLLDLMLPDARGLDALHRVRARAPEIRIAVMSAQEDRDTVDRVLRAGAVGFVPKSADRTTLLDALSPRQTQVLRLMIRGLPNKEICRELGLSENTVKIHIGSVLRGLRARTRTEAVSLASRVGFGAH